jgi:RNA polymerase sigma-70 factor (ECF subfamily)
MKGDEEDIALVRRFKNGDEKAFDRLFEKYQVPLYSICYRFSRNEADARDLTQDIFIKVYANLKKFHEKSKFFTWLYRIAVNTCISFKRKTKPRLIDYQPHQETVTMDERVRMKIAIDDALGQLPERQRMSFILHHYDGYTFDEIGDIMGISSGAAKANHYHAMRKLQVLLKEYV